MKSRFGAQASCQRCASILLALLFAAVSLQAQQIPRCGDVAVPPKGGCLTREYDRFKDSTIAALRFTVVDKGIDHRVMLILMSTYAGDSPAGKDRTYALAIASIGTRVEPSSIGRVVDVLIDGRDRSTMTMVATRAMSGASGVSAEQLLTMMSEADITRLARAKTLEMRLGQDEFAFDDTMRQNLTLFWGDYVDLLHK